MGIRTQYQVRNLGLDGFVRSEPDLVGWLSHAIAMARKGEAARLPRGTFIDMPETAELLWETLGNDIAFSPPEGDWRITKLASTPSELTYATMTTTPASVFQVRVCRLGDHVDHPLSTVKPAASNLVRLSPDGIIPQIEYAASFTLAHLLNRAPAMG